MSHDKFDFNQTSAFSGFAQPPITGNQSDTPVTPKFGLSYQLDANNFLYFTAAKGYRQGGVNESVPANLCAADLTTLGLTSTPIGYTPDSLWSFEVGAKDSLFGGRLGLDSSVYTLNQNGTPAVDSRVFSYDPTLPQPGAQKSLSMRAGMYTDRLPAMSFQNHFSTRPSVAKVVRITAPMPVTNIQSLACSMDVRIDPNSLFISARSSPNSWAISVRTLPNSLATSVLKH
ncbi:MAG: TonB-dependent receptor [Gammaproteobacteria bacterium]|nr:TonB-dependent receptor [Gammaproteobacteria bacterium]